MNKLFRIASEKELLDDLKKPNFGSFIIASKLKFYWIEDKSIFIRISQLFPNKFYVEICNWIVLVEQENNLEEKMFRKVYYAPKNKTELEYVISQLDPFNNSLFIHKENIPIKLITFTVDMDGFEDYEEF